jgi:hypothetical protein
MKKLLLISVLVCLAAVNQVLATNPIPSYNVLVTGRANFQEKNTKPIGGLPIGKEKRQMNVESSTASPTAGFSNTVIVAVIYRLDGQVRKGPYYIISGQTLSVGIDDQAWGVDVLAQDPALVSVYTSSDSPAD